MNPPVTKLKEGYEQNMYSLTADLYVVALNTVWVVQLARHSHISIVASPIFVLPILRV